LLIRDVELGVQSFPWRQPNNLHFGQDCPILSLLKGSEFIRKVKKLAKKTGKTVTHNSERGKGSHTTLYYGKEFTMRDPKDELKTGTFNAMLKQLGIRAEDLS
jgi:mRNA interferase HicA